MPHCRHWRRPREARVPAETRLGIDRLGIDKAAVAGRFNRSAAGYDAACRVQHSLAERLMAQLAGLAAPARILELGCGTGYLTGLLSERYPEARITAVDFAHRMVEVARRRLAGRRVDLQVADAESAGFGAGVFDLIVSNATIQWFDDPASALPGLVSALRPGASMVHTTFGPETFRELKGLLEPDGAVGLPLRPAEEWHRLLCDCGLVDVRSRSQIQVIRYPGARDLLLELQATGATCRPNGAEATPAAPKRLMRAVAGYDARFGSPQGVPVTYELLEVCGDRP